MFDIVMPLFNKQDFVASSIECVLRQDFERWRLWIVDDGSTDGGVEVVERFSDSRITLLRQQNAGPGAARNAGIAAGEAPWIAFLDADDIWLAGHLRELDVLRRDFSAAALIGTAYVEWRGAETLPPRRLAAAARREIRYFHEIALRTRPLYTSSAAVSRRAIEEVGPLQPVVVGDETELWARLALHGPVAVSSKCTVLYRLSSGGITDSNVQEDDSWSGRQVELQDVSLPLATLASRFSELHDPVLRGDVSDYINYELESALLKAVTENRIGDARKIGRLFLRRPTAKARLASILAHLPPPLGQRIIHAIFAIKSLGRGLVSGGAPI